MLHLRRPGLIFGSTAALAALAVWLAAGPAGAEARRDVLEGDARLSASVDVAAAEEPFAEFLESVGTSAGVELKASREVSRDRITAFAHQRPLRELLTRIAKHFDYTWTRERRGGRTAYVLVQDAASRQREEAAADAWQAAARAAVRATLDDRVREAQSPEAREAARQPPAAREQQIAALQAQLENSQRNAVEVRERLTAQVRILRSVTPVQSYFNTEDAVFRLYAALPEALRNQLWEGTPLAFSFPAEPGRHPLSAAVAAEMLAGRLGELRRRDTGDGTPGEPVPMRSLDAARGELFLQREEGRASLRLRLRYLGSIGEETEPATRTNGSIDEEPALGWDRLPEEQPGLDAAAARLSETVSLREPRDEAGKPLRYWTAEHVFRELARVTTYPLIADAYGGSIGGGFRFSDLPLSAALQRLCHYTRYRCVYQDGYLLFRACDWQKTKRYRAPADAVSRWERNCRERGAFTLQDLTEIAGLGADRAESLRTWWDLRRRLPTGAVSLLQADLTQSGDALRALHALPPEQLRLLETGGILSVARLSPVARAEVRRTLSGLYSEQFGYDEDEPDLPRHSSEEAYHREERVEALWPRAAISLRRSPATWYFNSLAYFENDPDAALANERERNPDARPSDIRRLEGEKVLLTFQIPGLPAVTHQFCVPPQASR